MPDTVAHTDMLHEKSLRQILIQDTEKTQRATNMHRDTDLQAQTQTQR